MGFGYQVSVFILRFSGFVFQVSGFEGEVEGSRLKEQVVMPSVECSATASQ